MSTTPVQADQYAGQRLGLPATGSGAVASWSRRILALVLDWFASMAVTVLVGPLLGFEEALPPWLILLVFWVESSIGTALAGGSFGQLSVRIAVRRLDGRPLDPFGALLRQLLVCLVVPPVIYNRDNRGLHDLSVRTVVINR